MGGHSSARLARPVCANIGATVSPPRILNHARATKLQDHLCARTTCVDPVEGTGCAATTAKGIETVEQSSLAIGRRDVFAGLPV